MMSIDDVLDILRIKLLGIPDDQEIVVSRTGASRLFSIGTAVSQAYHNICRRIEGEDVPFMTMDTGFMQRLGRLLGIGGRRRNAN